MSKKRSPNRGTSGSPVAPGRREGRTYLGFQAVSRRLQKVRWFLWLLGAGVAAGIVFGVWLYGRPTPPASPTETFPVPPLSVSPFLNTGPDAHYVGTGACIDCHPRNHDSYLLTAHSRALSDLDPNAEPPDGSFEHKTSGRSYRVYRRDGQLRHEEVLRTAEGKEIARVDLPIRYLIGSGHFSRSYLVEIDGFLHESPITWYAFKKQWGISPGYDTPQHWSFERPITVTCLACHTGRVEAQGTVNRLRLQEKAIGCESCHGPGSLHMALRKKGNVAVGDEDWTIVHPGRLSRPLLEAVCGVCHLNGPAQTFVRGREPTDFRPGMPLGDYRIDYHFDTGNDQMTVVGHMEQLRQSVCYQKSKDLTCLTCHDPHAREKPKDPTAFYRQKCLDCHSTRACRLEPAQRLQKDASDNCMNCHMPRGNTDIPHIAFTHHRIGRHTPKPPANRQRVPELVPLDDVSHLGLRDRQRNLGLAYLDAARKPECSPYAGAFHDRARELLETVHAAGLDEGETAEGLAEIYWEKAPALSSRYARQALEAKKALPEVHALALLDLAKWEMKSLNYSSAADLLKELVLLRRCSEDWCLLGMCYLVQNQPQEALSALQHALAIRPDRTIIHLGLAETYRQLGDVQRAHEHQEKAQWLSQHGPQ
jgi:Tetratricopeptide repeat/Cytochrome c554 and c-prime